MKTVKQVAAAEVRFMWAPMTLGFLVTMLAYVMVLRNEVNIAYGIMSGCIVWHVMTLLALLSFRTDVKQWAVMYRGKY